MAQYFEQMKGRPLRFPCLPCIHAGPKQKKQYIPMELLDIYSPQKVNKKLTDTQTATMIRVSLAKFLPATFQMPDSLN